MGVNLLDVQDMKMVVVALEALENILECGKKKQTQHNLDTNPHAVQVQQVYGHSKIEALQEEVNEHVYQKAMKILEHYFLEDEDDAVDMNGTKDDDDAVDMTFE